MITNNPFATLSEIVSPIAMQGFFNFYDCVSVNRNIS